MKKYNKRILIIIFLIFSIFNVNFSIAIPKSHTSYKKYHINKKNESQVLENSNVYNEKKDNDLLMNAFSLLGIVYKYGGNNPRHGLDCSGFIKYIFKETLDVDLPRTVAGLLNVGTSIKNKEELKLGDLVFFNTIGKRVSHIGMYIGNNEFIHAPRTGKKIEIQSLNNHYWSKRYIIAKRITTARKNPEINDWIKKIY